jgi:serine/threonine protein phosphatase PrpC
VCGASHHRTGIKNQDYIAWWVSPLGQAQLSVADGHGSPRSCRSEIGARLAVEVSHAIGTGLILRQPDVSELSMVKEWLEQEAPKRIVLAWRSRVEEDLKVHPLTHDEKSLVGEDESLAYGTTLITVVATRAFTALWQIGDGDVVAVSPSEPPERALPRDAEHIGNETMSLCSQDAWAHFRVGFHVTPIPLLLLSSDGLVNSFQDDAGFLRFAADVGRLIASDGLEAVTERLPHWLEEASVKGSGDDISLGLVCRPELLAPRGRAR